MRPAIALIELILAIVVMAIAFLAIPPVMESSTASVETIIRQEAVSIASTQMSTIGKLPWDEAETNDTKNGGYAKIVDVDDNTQAISSYGYGRSSSNTNYRIGAVTMHADEGKYRRRFYNTVTPASATLGPETGETSPDSYNDVDDYNGYNITLNEQNATGYKFPYDINVTVSYHANDITDDTAPSGTTNIKTVDIKVRNRTTGDEVVLRSFYCNIGETKILTRYLP